MGHHRERQRRTDYTWSAPADGEWSLLLAADGTKPAPSSISMTFPNDTSTPWAVPLMVLGVLLILVGGAAVPRKPGQRRRRRRDEARERETARWWRNCHPAHPAGGNAAGQQRSARPGRPRVTQAGVDGRRPTAGSEGRPGRITGLAATRQRSWSDGTAIAAQATTPPGHRRRPLPQRLPTAESPVLLDSQFRRILEQVAGAVDAGDAAKDAGKLGPAWAARKCRSGPQNYKIRSQVGAYEARMPVRATKLLTTVVTTDRDWPRTVLAVTQGEGNVVPQLLTLIQDSPRENYKLVHQHTAAAWRHVPRPCAGAARNSAWRRRKRQDCSTAARRRWPASATA